MKNEKYNKNMITIVMAAQSMFLGNGYRTFSKSLGETATHTGVQIAEKNWTPNTVTLSNILILPEITKEN